jgi:hypothetical protein
MCRVWAYLLCGILALGLSESVVPGAENQIQNGEFDEGTTSWARYGASGYTLSVVQDAGLSGDNALMIDVTDAAGTTAIGASQSGLRIEPGVTYPIGFTAKAEQPRDMVVLLQAEIRGATTTWPTYLTQTVQLTTEPQTFNIEYTHSGETIGDDATEILTLYLMLKGTWWPMTGDDQNKRVWIDRVYFGAVPPPPRRDRATKPSPANGAQDVPRGTVLSWTAGAFADTQDVYLGTSATDVNTASRTSPLNVLAGQGQAESAYDPAGALEFGRTYFWRVDEVNAPPDSTITKGNVWSFTVEPYVYPIQNIIATAVSSYADQGPENTINGSGLTGDLHSTLDTTMWATRMGVVPPVWIQYEFDKVYTLHEMWVWNYNTDYEMYFGSGFKDVTVEYSSDGADWTTLGQFEFARAPGVKDYEHGTTVDFQGAAAKYVRLTATSKWGDLLPQYGLSEVRFYYLPVQARQPSPASGATGVPVDTLLTWRSGRKAASHEVYFSADKDAVAGGTALAGTGAENSYDPGALGLLYGQTYYWKVNEVNAAETPGSWPGDVWDFTLIDYLVVDDFEGYTNDSPNRVFQTWIDGYGFSPDEFFPQGNSGNGSGAMIGYDPQAGDIMEKTIVHGGRQAMPMDYNNTAAPSYSEAERTWETPQDWTRHGGDTLQLYFHGRTARFREPEPGTYLVGSMSGDVSGTADHMRLVYKRITGDATIVAKVHSVTNTWPWAKAGVTIRETPAPDATHAIMFMTPVGRPAFENRRTTGGISYSAYGNLDEVTLPQWVKLERKGSQFTGYRSDDGVNWTLQTNNGGGDSPNPQTILMPAGVCIGMFVTSNNLSQACIGEFSDVTITGSVSGDWQVADVGGNNPANTPDTLYLVVKDSNGHVATIEHPDPDALVSIDWQQWNTPLSRLTAAGVNPARVVKMAIGTGNPARSAPGGAGRLYIDDIQVTREVLLEAPGPAGGQ